MVRGTVVRLVGLVGLIGLVGVVIARRDGATPAVRTVAVSPNSGGLAVDEQRRRAFVGGPNGRVQVLDIASGVLLRTVNLDPAPDRIFVTAIVVVARSRRLFVATGHFAGTAGTRDAVVMLDTYGRQILRTTPIAASHGPMLSVDARTDRVFVVAPPPWPGREGQVSVLDARSGRPLRRVALAGLPYNVYNLVIDPGTGEVFLTDTDTGVVSALDGRTGQDLWQRRPHKAAVPGRAVTTGRPAVDGRHHRVFIANFVTGTVGAYDMRDGRLVGEARLSHGGPTALIANARAGRVFAIQSGWVHVLDATSGRLLRAIGIGQRFKVVHDLQLTLDVAHNRVLIVDPRANAVSLLDGVSGRLLHTSSLPPITIAASPAVDERDGSIVVANAGLPDRMGNLDNLASVSVIDSANGTIRRIIPVGRGPGEVAMDEQGGRVVVLNPAGPRGTASVADPWRWVPAYLRHLLPFLSPPTSPATAGEVSIVDMPH